MTVGELIEALSRFDPRTQVFVSPQAKANTYGRGAEHVYEAMDLPCDLKGDDAEGLRRLVQPGVNFGRPTAPRAIVIAADAR